MGPKPPVVKTKKTQPVETGAVSKAVEPDKDEVTYQIAQFLQSNL